MEMNFCDLIDCHPVLTDNAHYDESMFRFLLQDMWAQLFVGFHATFEIFHHCQRIVELGIKLCNSLVECVLVEQL